jgi:hypothetical protein
VRVGSLETKMDVLAFLVLVATGGVSMSIYESRDIGK